MVGAAPLGIHPEAVEGRAFLIAAKGLGLGSQDLAGKATILALFATVMTGYRRLFWTRHDPCWRRGSLCRADQLPWRKAAQHQFGSLPAGFHQAGIGPGRPTGILGNLGGQTHLYPRQSPRRALLLPNFFHLPLIAQRGIPDLGGGTGLQLREPNWGL
jgi:hypothetical protein